MKDNLPCAVVRDLLPIYVEGLTEPETNAAVEAHLKTCPACTARLAAMRAPEPPPEAETAKEVDYLKKVKRRSWKRVVLAVLVTVLVLMGALAAKLFLLGSAAGPESMVFYVEQSGEILSLRISSVASANAYWGWNTKSQDGVVEISAREGLVSPLHNTASAKLDIPLEGVQEVYLCGRLIWQEGTITAGQALKQFETLYAARTPYVGNPSALNAVAQALNLDRPCWRAFTRRGQSSCRSRRRTSWTGVLRRRMETRRPSIRWRAISWRRRSRKAGRMPCGICPPRRPRGTRRPVSSWESRC